LEKNRFGEDIRIGRFASFDRFIRAIFNNSAELVVRARNSYNRRSTDTALGTIRSLGSEGQAFEKRTAQLEADLQDSQKRATELETEVGKPFKKEDRYHHQVKRQSEIEKKVDLTKNQAPSQVDRTVTDDREDTSEKKSQTDSIRHPQRTAVRV
jgi:predicted  nucleic acid-binding Zn-ribbon protein